MSEAMKPAAGTAAPPEGIERRRAGRFRPGPLRVQLAGGPGGTLVDLSEFGALLILPGACDVGSFVSFDLHLEDGDVRLHGRVVRCSPSYEEAWRLEWVEPSSYKVAVDFFDLDEQCLTTLQELFLKATRDAST
jgi:hypothetical protein